ncbi:MAG: PIN domain-containing protein [Bacteroidales bacterium]|nr:PIN domain-containing protein [Bacteroidales bacterium]
MTRIFLDTNVILDLFIPGREGKAAARTLLDLKETAADSIRLYLSFLSVADIAYVLRKHYDAPRIKELIRELFRLCNILSVSDISLLDALDSACPDFEDAIQISCAETAGCDFLLTSNLRHFRDHTWMTVLTPAQFLTELEAHNRPAE